MIRSQKYPPAINTQETGKIGGNKFWTVDTRSGRTVVPARWETHEVSPLIAWLSVQTPVGTGTAKYKSQAEHCALVS